MLFFATMDNDYLHHYNEDNFFLSLIINKLFSITSLHVIKEKLF